MPTALITGCNRGIGLEFVRQYAADGWSVRATCRNPRGAKELAAIAGDVKVHGLDVADDYQVAALAKSLADEPIDLLINNAGVGGPEDEFGKTPANDWLEVLRVNTIAPLHVAEQFIGNLDQDGQHRRQRRRLLHLSDQQGGAQHGRQEHGAGPEGQAHDRGGLPSRLGEDRHGRAARADPAEGQRRRHARQDRRPYAGRQRQVLQL
jgi:NAD(P)-dependent dehydrogenase (short-subunit alcohol dehydrogenase family)